MIKGSSAMHSTIQRRATASDQFCYPLGNLIEICEVKGRAQMNRTILGCSQRLLKSICTSPVQDQPSPQPAQHNGGRSPNPRRGPGDKHTFSREVQWVVHDAPSRFCAQNAW